MTVGIFLNGWTGRMGAEVRALVEGNQGDFSLVGGRARTVVTGNPTVYQQLPDPKPQGADVVIDFSLPDSWQELLSWCVAQKLPLVSGTTGLGDRDHQAMLVASKSIPILWAPNMSLGVAVLTQALEVLSALSHADFQIEEFHHNRKLDRPSGTALHLQKALQDVVKKSLPEPLAIRGGGIYGVHRVHVMTEEETLTFEHQALNRQVFARGALLGAKWLRTCSPGLYRMSDLISSRG